MTKLETIEKRIESLKQWETWRNKCFKFRKLVVGDVSDVSSSMGKQESEVTAGKAKERNDRYTIDVRDFESMQSNTLFKVLRVLVLQSGFSLPEFSFQGLEPEDDAAHQEYVRVRLGAPPRGCGYKSQRDLAAWDTAITGIGVMMLTMRMVDSESGWPIPEYIEAERVGWDKEATSISSAKWRTAELEMSVASIDERFGEGAFVKAVAGKLKADDTDAVFKVIYYYDVCEGGTAMMAIVENHAIVGDPLYHGENPFVYSVDGYDVPFLPIFINAPFEMGRVEFPVGAVELAARHQLDAWTIQRRKREEFQRGRTFQAINSESVAKEDLDAFVKGDSNLETLKVQGDPKEVLARVGGVQISPELFNAEAQEEQRMRDVVGVTNYSLGGNAGVDYAIEADLISKEAGIVGAYLLDSSAAWQVEMVAGWLAACSEYDTGNLTLRVGEVKYPFGTGMTEEGEERIGPPGMFLQPDAQISIQRDSMLYRTRKEEMQEAVERLSVLAPFAAQYSSMGDNLVSDFLAASGRPTQKYMEKAPVAAAIPTGQEQVQ